jgi:thymidylate synthase
MLAQVVNMVPLEVIWVGGDVHLYTNHLDTFKEQLERNPLSLPILNLNHEVYDLFEFKLEDISLDGYVSHEKIGYKVSV